MATLPKVFRKTGPPDSVAASSESGRRLAPARMEPAPFQLRALPHEDVFFYCKKIDNTRLVREADPKSRGTCWHTIGAACLVVAALTGVLAPNLAHIMAGYKLEALRVEHRKLLDERRALELQEAALLSPERLQKLARDQNLVTPASGQVIRLDNHADGTVAMVK
jgi:cell division protein FtsL